MKLELEVMKCLCELSVFTINDIEADYNDFGTKCDSGYDDYYNDEVVTDGGCLNMTFHSDHPTKEVLEKYNITKEEYSEITTLLTEKLSFGTCGWCI